MNQAQHTSVGDAYILKENHLVRKISIGWLISIRMKYYISQQSVL
jgi:hypothetical protein